MLQKLKTHVIGNFLLTPEFIISLQPKILIISRDSWNETNNVGNTLSNLFRNWDTTRIANIYCREEIPNNKICKLYLKVSERDIINRILFKKYQKTNTILISRSEKKLQDEIAEKEKRIYHFFRNHRWHILLWIRELLWLTGIWKSKEVKRFIKEFKPDIIFSQSYDSFYMHDLLHYSRSISNAKVVLFHCDDLVTFRQYSLSPLYWVNRFILRRKMNKSIKIASKNYCIIDEQARIYSQIYNIEFELLYKSNSFQELPRPREINVPLKFVYTGNIIYGRIKTLIKVAQALQVANNKGEKAKLYLYTPNEISNAEKNALLKTGCVEVMGKVEYNEIPKILGSSDILIHIESFERKQLYATSLSFSTKLVDYLQAAKPILAIGWKEAASIKYIAENKIGITVDDHKNLISTITELIDKYSRFNKLGMKAWKFGKVHHDEVNVFSRFEKQMKAICED